MKLSNSFAPRPHRNRLRLLTSGLLASALAIAFAACGGDDGAGNGGLSGTIETNGTDRGYGVYSTVGAISISDGFSGTITTTA